MSDRALDALSQVRETRMLVGVCGAVAALGTHHALLWARSQLGLVRVRVVLTTAAQRLVTSTSLEAVVDGPAIAGWEDLEAGAAPHIRLAQWPDVILALPATANLLAKVSHGVADDLLSTVLLAATCPVVLAPSMNPSMWAKPAVQRNVHQLRSDGYVVIEPGAGISLTSGDAEAGSITDARRPIVTALAQALGRATNEFDLGEPLGAGAGVS